MEEIFKFDLESALMMDVESDYNPSNKDDEEDEA
jgi:hypothetical protein